MNGTMKTLLLIILLLPINCLATSEIYIVNSICELQKTIYVPIGNDDKKPKATFELDEKPTGETYTLTINNYILKVLILLNNSFRALFLLIKYVFNFNFILQ